jgi:TolB protein
MNRLVLLAFALSSHAMAQTHESLGIFEGAGDIGTPSHKGKVVYNPATREYSVTGGGNNMWATRDDFFFVWKKVTGDVILTADLKIVTGGNNHRKAGLIIRKELEPGSVYADAVVHGDGLTALQWREKAGDITRTVHFPLNAPTKLRFERRRNRIIISAGKDTLTELGDTELATFNPMYVGLAVCAHDDAAETTAVFSNVTVEIVPLPPPSANAK